MKENKFTKSLKEMMNKSYLGKMDEEEANMHKKHKEEEANMHKRKEEEAKMHKEIEEEEAMMHKRHDEEKKKMEELKKKMKTEGPGHYDAEAPHHYKM